MVTSGLYNIRALDFSAISVRFSWLLPLLMRCVGPQEVLLSTPASFKLIKKTPVNS